MAGPDRPSSDVLLDDRGLASLDLPTLDRLTAALRTPIPKTAPALATAMEFRWYRP
jgi:hypothetical protein